MSEMTTMTYDETLYKHQLPPVPISRPMDAKFEETKPKTLDTLIFYHLRSPTWWILCMCECVCNCIWRQKEKGEWKVERILLPFWPGAPTTQNNFTTLATTDGKNCVRIFILFFIIRLGFSYLQLFFLFFFFVLFFSIGIFSINFSPLIARIEK